MPPNGRRTERNRPRRTRFTLNLNQIVQSALAPGASRTFPRRPRVAVAASQTLESYDFGSLLNELKEDASTVEPATPSPIAQTPSTVGDVDITVPPPTLEGTQQMLDAPAAVPVEMPDAPAATPFQMPDAPAAAPVEMLDVPAAAPFEMPDPPKFDLQAYRQKLAPESAVKDVPTPSVKSFEAVGTGGVDSTNAAPPTSNPLAVRYG